MASSSVLPASADLGGEAAILNLKNGVYYRLDPVGARVWDLIEEPWRVRAVRDTILAEYDVNAERCERDLVALLEQLAERDLIDVVDDAQGLSVLVCVLESEHNSSRDVRLDDGLTAIFRLLFVCVRTTGYGFLLRQRDIIDVFSNLAWSETSKRNPLELLSLLPMLAAFTIHNRYLISCGLANASFSASRKGRIAK